jgi:hypothetical protein
MLFDIKIFFNMANSNQHRKLTFTYRSRNLSFNRLQVVPELRLSGLWLQELGFSPGDRVEVISRDRLLIIQPVRDPEPDLSKTELRNMKKTLKELL